MEKGTEAVAEHGLGAAHRLHHHAQAATGAPVTAQEYRFIKSVLDKAHIVRYGQNKVVPRSSAFVLDDFHQGLF